MIDEEQELNAAFYAYLRLPRHATGFAVTLPPGWCARETLLCIRGERQTWRICAIDRHGNEYPVTAAGQPPTGPYRSPRIASELLLALSAAPGHRVWAERSHL